MHPDSKPRGSKAHLQRQIENLEAENMDLRDRLQTLQTRHDCLFKDCPFPVLVSDFEGNIVDANPEILRFFGMQSVEELRRLNIRQVYRNIGYDRPFILSELQRTGELNNYALEVMTPAGETHVVEVSSRVIELDGQKLIETVGWDITAKRLLETKEKEYRQELELSVEQRTREVQTSELKYRTLVDNANDAIIIVQNGRVVFANAAAYRLVKISGFQPAAIYLDWVLPAQRKITRNYFRRWLTGKTVPQYLEIILLTSQDDKVFVQVKPARIVFDGQPAVMAIVRDITLQRRFEEDLLHGRKLESLGKLAGNIAHNFNNILGTILGYASLIESQPDLTPKVAQMSRYIARTAMYGAELTSRLSGFAEKGKTEHVDFDINELVEDVLELLTKGLPFNVKLNWERGHTLTCQADRPQLYHAFLNICLNAVEAMESGGTLSIQTRLVFSEDLEDTLVTSLSPGDYVMVEIMDTGKGIDPAIRDRIFEPFFTTKEKVRGTGLGLPMAYGIIRNHGGRIQIFSEPGDGTTVRILLPVKSESTPDTRPLTLDKPPTTLGVLIVDDEPFIREFAKDVLGEFGYTPFLASDGAEALQLFQQNQDEIAAVVLDILMPGMDGYQTATKLREISPHVTIIFTSGLQEEKRLEEFLSRPGFYFLRKPYTMENLLGALTRIVSEEDRMP
ncbi:MAG: response regulator [Acidobacteria bacterium]|nr:response regulator [Acidobacteriota bacterium]